MPCCFIIPVNRFLLACVRNYRRNNRICVLRGGNHGDLFAVFDRFTELYAVCKDYFNDVDRQLSDSLESATIVELLRKA